MITMFKKFKQFVKESKGRKVDQPSGSTEFDNTIGKQKREREDLKDRQYDERERARQRDYQARKAERNRSTEKASAERKSADVAKNESVEDDNGPLEDGTDKLVTTYKKDVPGQ